MVYIRFNLRNLWIDFTLTVTASIIVRKNTGVSAE